MIFLADAYNHPARPCVWCGRACWDAWQQCGCRYRLHPWHHPSWWKMLARLRMHESWGRKYAARHPEHRGRVWATLRAERLRWHWSGRSPMRWNSGFEVWGLAR